MDFVRSYFGTDEPLTSWTLFSSLFDWFAVCAKQTSQKVRKKVFNWSEVNLYQSNFLQNPHFSCNPEILFIHIKFIKGKANIFNQIICTAKSRHWAELYNEKCLKIWKLPKTYFILGKLRFISRCISALWLA